MTFDGYTSLCHRASDHFVKQLIVEITVFDRCVIRKHFDEIVLVKFGAEAEILHATQELLSGLRLLVFCEVLDKVTMVGFIHPARSPANIKALTIGKRNLETPRRFSFLDASRPVRHRLGVRQGFAARVLRRRSGPAVQS